MATILLTETTVAMSIAAIMERQTARAIAGPSEIVEEEEEVHRRGHATDARRKDTGAQTALNYKQGEEEVEVEEAITVVMVINSLQAEGVVRQQDPVLSVERQVTGVLNVRRLVEVVKDTKNSLFLDVACTLQSCMIMVDSTGTLLRLLIR